MELLISKVFPPQVGGSGRWFWEVYRRLPASEVAVAADRSPGQEEVDYSADLSIHRLPLDLRPDPFSPTSWREYRRALRRLRPLLDDLEVDRIHCGRCLPEGLLALHLSRHTGIPFLCYCHGEDVNLSNWEERPPAWRRRVYGSRELGFLAGLVIRRAQLLIANSRNTRNVLVERWGVSSDHVRILHPGVDTSRFVPAARGREVRQRLGWGERPVVLTVGRLQPRKGQDMLIRALPAIRRHAPEVLYAVAGDGEARDSLEELVQELGLGDHVMMMGEISDEILLRCYQQCDLFVLPNRQVDSDIEGFGMVLLEAQACGRAVVAGRSGGTAETMRVPETGLLVRCETPEPLAEVVTELLGDPVRRDAMGRAGRAWVVERFDWAALAEQAATLFAETAAPANGVSAQPPGGAARRVAALSEGVGPRDELPAPSSTTDASPFFVLGTQRSGTTLLYQMLNCHSELYVLNEFWEIYPYLTGEKQDRQALERLLVRQLRLSGSYLTPDESPPERPFDHVDRAFELKLREMGKRRWGLKQPRLTYYLDLFAERYPEARFVVLLRDPRGAINSILRRKVNVANAFAGARLWKEMVELQEGFLRRHPDRARLVRFEELLSAPEEELRGICDFLGVGFEEEMLRFYLHRPETSMHAGNINITRPVDRAIAEKWHHQLSPHQIGVIDTVLGEMLEAWGYPRAAQPVRLTSVHRGLYHLHQKIMTTWWWQRRSGWHGIRSRLRLGSPRER